MLGSNLDLLQACRDDLLSDLSGLSLCIFCVTLGQSLVSFIILRTAM